MAVTVTLYSFGCDVVTVELYATSSVALVTPVLVNVGTPTTTIVKDCVAVDKLLSVANNTTL